jgi:broad specificity phosphatase PhoE
MAPSTTQLWVVVAAPVVAVLIGTIVLRSKSQLRRSLSSSSSSTSSSSSSSSRSSLYVFRHASLDDAPSPGRKLIFIQRHGQTSKNLANPPIRKEVYAKIEAARQLSTVQETEAAIDDAVAQWRAHSQHDAWFDDCLNQEGAEQAAAAGREVGEVLAERGVPLRDVLAVTSPFRRAVQTQQIGWQSAAVGSSSAAVLGLDAPWVAQDSLSETPWQQSACLRHDRSELSRWTPLLDVSGIAESTPPSSIVASRGLTEVEGKLRGVGQQEAHRDNARAFSSWLRGRPESVIWVTTHQGPVPHLVEALLGDAFRPEEFSNLKPQNCQVVALVL